MKKRRVYVDVLCNSEETKRRCDSFKKLLEDKSFRFKIINGFNNGKFIRFEIYCAPDQDYSDQDYSIVASLDGIFGQNLKVNNRYDISVSRVSDNLYWIVRRNF